MCMIIGMRVQMFAWVLTEKSADQFGKKYRHPSHNMFCLAHF